MSAASSFAGGACSGPNRLSKSAMDVFLVEFSASVDTSETDKHSFNHRLFEEVISVLTREDKASLTQKEAIRNWTPSLMT